MIPHPLSFFFGLELLSLAVNASNCVTLTVLLIKRDYIQSAADLRDELVVVGQVSSAVDAAVGSVAARQVRLKSLGARHSDHGRCWRAVQEGTASPGRLTREAPQHTGEGRGGRWVGRRTPERREDRRGDNGYMAV